MTTPNDTTSLPFDISGYDHLLLDMNGTFVMDFDQFGPEADFGATYDRLGYSSVPTAKAHQAVRDAYEYLAVRYIDPAYFGAFPGVDEALCSTGYENLASATHAELIDTFAVHEMGHLPPAHAAALHRLKQLRPLSVLSNLWAPPSRWHAAFAEWGISRLFDHTLFSSKGQVIKPNPDFFNVALTATGLSPKRMLYIGDSYNRDVVGAQSVGMDAAWVHPSAMTNAAGTGLHVAAAANLPALVARIDAAHTPQTIS